MNSFFMYWVDRTAMLLSLTLAVVFTIRYKKKGVQRLHAVPLFLLLFGPLVIIVHMGFHNFEILYRAVLAAIDSKFTYSFRFYSLMLMGVLVLWLSVIFLKQSVGVYVWGNLSKISLWKTAGIIALITLPTIPFTPIGSLPVMACLINLIACAFVQKRAVTVPAEPQLALESVL